MLSFQWSPLVRQRCTLVSVIDSVRRYLPVDSGRPFLSYQYSFITREAEGRGEWETTSSTLSRKLARYCYLKGRDRNSVCIVKPDSSTDS
jgi:hypothetical protein